MASVREPGFMRSRWRSLVAATTLASNAEKVRGALALFLVGVLIALQIVTPDGSDTIGNLVTAARTLAISVVAFYFGLHTTPAAGRRIRGRA